MTWIGVASSGELLHAMGDENLVLYSELIGDVTGTVGVTVVSGIQESPVSPTPPRETEILVFTGGQWTPVTDSGGAGGAHNLLSATHSDTDVDSPTQGAIIRANSTPKWEEYEKGTEGYVLYAGGSDVEWTQLGAVTPFALGTSAAPSMTFVGDVDTGWSAETANTLIGTAGGNEMLTLDGANDNLVLNGGQIIRDTDTVGAYTVTVADYIVSVKNSEAITITMPAAPVSGELHIVKDANGNAKSNAITVDGNGNDIDGNATVIMRNNFSALTLMYNGTQWSII